MIGIRFEHLKEIIWTWLGFGCQLCVGKCTSEADRVPVGWWQAIQHIQTTIIGSYSIYSKSWHLINSLHTKSVCFQFKMLRRAASTESEQFQRADADEEGEETMDNALKVWLAHLLSMFWIRLRRHSQKLGRKRKAAFKRLRISWKHFWARDDQNQKEPLLAMKVLIMRHHLHQPEGHWSKLNDTIHL